VTVDLDNELLEVRFDPHKMTPQTLLQTVGKLGFQGKIKGR
jgi:hypothetical protein